MRQLATPCLLLALYGLAACTPAARPAVCPPVPATASTPTSPIAPEDDALRRWKAIAATPAKAPPAGTSAASLVPELVAYLASPDPVRRDTIAYEVFATWLDAKTLDDAAARALARSLIENLASPQGAPDGVFRRSFSVLVLGDVVRRDRKSPFLSDEERHAILNAARDYAARETDLRGHTGTTGWAHAAAHTGDLLARLALLPSLTDADRAVILDAVVSLVVRRHGTILAYGEDGRLATSVVAAVRSGVTPAAIDTFVAALRAPLVEPATSTFDAGQFAAQRNARNLLFTLYVHGSTNPSPTPGERALFEKVRAVIVE